MSILSKATESAAYDRERKTRTLITASAFLLSSPMMAASGEAVARMTDGGWVTHGFESETGYIYSAIIPLAIVAGVVMLYRAGYRLKKHPPLRFRFLSIILIAGWLWRVLNLEAIAPTLGYVILTWIYFIPLLIAETIIDAATSTSAINILMAMAAYLLLPYTIFYKASKALSAYRIAKSESAPPVAESF